MVYEEHYKSMVSLIFKCFTVGSIFLSQYKNAAFCDTDKFVDIMWATDARNGLRLCWIQILTTLWFIMNFTIYVVLLHCDHQPRVDSKWRFMITGGARSLVKLITNSTMISCWPYTKLWELANNQHAVTFAMFCFLKHTTHTLMLCIKVHRS